MTEELKQLREALRRVKHEAASLADAQVIALEALTQRPAAQTEREAFESRVTLNSIIKQYRIKAEDAHWLRASLPAPQQATPEPVGEPLAWMRKWAYEGETPQKTRNENGRMAWPAKFKFFPVTQGKCMSDDVPLYVPAAQATRESREADQRARMQARLATRHEGKASADFDLPAPNDAIQQATPAQEVHPLASRCYAMSEPHLSGYRLVLGFETLEAVDAAHTWVANVRKAPQQATPEPVGESVYQIRLVDGAWMDLTKHVYEEKVKLGYMTVRKLHTRPAPGVPEDVQPNEMENKWCWWIGDDESFHTADTESEAHGEAQCRIDDDCEPGQTHLYSVARVQHPIDSIGMDWLAQHIADSIEEHSCEWCDDNTGAEEPSISLPIDDKKALGTMVAGFLRQRVGVKWWTADQRTVTVHTYVSGSNDAPALAAAQAKGADK